VTDRLPASRLAVAAVPGAPPASSGPGRRDEPGQVVLRLTREELLLLAGSVNEAIGAVEDWEFPPGSGQARPR